MGDNSIFYLTIESINFSSTRLEIVTSESFKFKSLSFIPDIGTRWFFDREVPSQGDNGKNNFYWSYPSPSNLPILYPSSPASYILYARNIDDKELFIVERNNNNSSFWDQTSIELMNDIINYVNLDSLNNLGTLIYGDVNPSNNIYANNLSILLSEPNNEDLGGIIVSNYLYKDEDDNIERDSNNTYILWYQDPQNPSNFYRINPRSSLVWLYNPDDTTVFILIINVKIIF